MQPPENELSSGDARTLSFASYRIDPALLDRLLRYQRALVEALGERSSADEIASAHRLALATAGLSQAVVERALAVVRRFAGNREVAGRLRASVAALPPERSADVQERLAALDHELRARDDAGTIALLLQHEGELLALHRRFLRLGGP